MKLDLVRFKHPPADLTNPNGGVFFGNVEHMGKLIPVYIPLIGGLDRHCVIISGSGGGKTNTIRVAVNDYINRYVFRCEEFAKPCSMVIFAVEKQFSDEEIYPMIPRQFIDRVIDVRADADTPVGLDLFAIKPGEDLDRRVKVVVEAFKRFSREAWGPVMEEVITMVAYAFCEAGGDIRYMKPFLAVEKKKRNTFREEILKRVKRVQTLRYWFYQYPAQYRQAPTSVTNKLTELEMDVAARSVNNRQKRFDLRQAMDSGKIVVVHLSTEVCRGLDVFFGVLWFFELCRAVFSRADTPEAERPFTWVIADEFARMCAGESETTDLFIRARKYRCGLLTAFQSRHLIDRRILLTIMANSEVKFVLPISSRDDARAFSEEIPE